MKITSIETLRTDEFATVLWVRLHTDAGLIGLGETFYGAGAIEAQIHDTFAGRLLGHGARDLGVGGGSRSAAWFSDPLAAPRAGLRPTANRMAAASLAASARQGAAMP